MFLRFSCRMVLVGSPAFVLLTAARADDDDDRPPPRPPAGLDVFEGIDVFTLTRQPPVHPLMELDNVLMTPHCGGSSVESTHESKVRGARHAVDVLQGRWPPHVVNPQVVPRFGL